MKLLREPLLHFMFIGAAIYLLYGVFTEPVPEGDDKTIVVSAGEIEWMLTFCGYNPMADCTDMKRMPGDTRP